MHISNISCLSVLFAHFRSFVHVCAQYSSKGGSTAHSGQRYESTCIIFQVHGMFAVKLAVYFGRWANYMQLHRKTVQSSATPIASHSTWRDWLSLCSHFNLLEQAIYCTRCIHIPHLRTATGRQLPGGQSPPGNPKSESR